MRNVAGKPLLRLPPSGCARKWESIASRGVGGTNERLSARDNTIDGKIRGNALVRRATDWRFLSAFRSCHLDIAFPGSFPWCPQSPKPSSPPHGAVRRKVNCEIDITLK